MNLLIPLSIFGVALFATTTITYSSYKTSAIPVSNPKPNKQIEDKPEPKIKLDLKKPVATNQK